MIIIDMNRSGDDRFTFDVDTDEAAVAKAMEKFNELIGMGKFASVPAEDGHSGRAIKKFDPTAKKILFRNQLIGG